MERANQTLQDRLIKEMRLAGVSSIDEAQAFADGFLERWNKRFAVAPRQAEDAHRRWSGSKADLAEALARREERTLSKRLPSAPARPATPSGRKDRERRCAAPRSRRHLSSMMRGHFAYYGVGGNIRRLRWFAHQVGSGRSHHRRSVRRGCRDGSAASTCRTRSGERDWPGGG